MSCKYFDLSPPSTPKPRPQPSGKPTRDMWADGDPTDIDDCGAWWTGCPGPPETHSLGPPPKCDTPPVAKTTVVNDMKLTAAMEETPPFPCIGNPGGAVASRDEGTAPTGKMTLPWAGCPGPPGAGSPGPPSGDATPPQAASEPGGATASREIEVPTLRSHCELPWYFEGLLTRAQADAVMKERPHALAEMGFIRRVTGSEYSAMHGRLDVFELDCYRDLLEPSDADVEAQYKAACKARGSTAKKGIPWASLFRLLRRCLGWG